MAHWISWQQQSRHSFRAERDAWSGCQDNSLWIALSLPPPTCVQVSASLQPPGRHHTAVGTSGSPPSCGRWHQRGTGRWTGTPPDMHRAPTKRRRKGWRCCSTSWHRFTTTNMDRQRQRGTLWAHVWQQDSLCHHRCWTRCLTRAPCCVFR